MHISALTAQLLLTTIAFAGPAMRYLITNTLTAASIPQGSTDPAVAPDCTWYGTILKPLDDCEEFATDWGMTLGQFIEYNPTINKDCSGIQLGHSYCLEVNLGEPREGGSPEATEEEEPNSSQSRLKSAHKAFSEAHKDGTLKKYWALMGGV